jgi:CO dehydrogenase maturation factor
VLGFMEDGLKIAISGKGGVGKTTLSALLSHLFAEDGPVLAVDADPDANLGSALGFDQTILERLVAISTDKELIKQRTGAEPGVSGQIFTLNPRVDDIPDKYVIEKNGVKLLRMGKVASGGSGCACPENTLLKQLLRHMVVKRNETVVLDMEAGLEHFGRGTADSVAAFIVVIEPGQRSIETAREVIRLAKDIGVERVYAVVNKVHPGQWEKVRTMIDFIPVLGYFPFDFRVVEADLDRRNVYETLPEFTEYAKKIKNQLISLLQEPMTVN